MGSIGGPADGDIAAASYPPLRSFWIAGFEGVDHRDAAVHDHDPQRVVRHLERAGDDHRGLTSLGIRTVRESPGWRLTERPSGFDVSRLRHVQAAAQANGIKIVSSLMHQGMLDDVDCFDEHFVEHF